MDLKEQIKSDLKTAMREGDHDKRDTLRMLLAAIQQIEVDDQVVLDNDGVQAVLAKQAKQRRESIDHAIKAGRKDMVKEEEAELAIVEAYLPQMMAEEEIRVIAQAVIEDVGATNMKDMGRVMGQLMPRLKGQADGGLVSNVVRQLLQG